MSVETRDQVVPGQQPRSDPPISGPAVGVAFFAAVLMVMVGAWNAIVGFAAILKNQSYAMNSNYVFKFDVTAWGWIHLVLGILLVIAGFVAFTGRTWARVVGIAVAALSAIGNFMSIPYYPVWSLLIIGVDVVVIWALVAYAPSAADAANDYWND